MKMSPIEASTLQDYLYLTTLDAYCPDAFIGGRQPAPINAHEIWQFAVEMIYRCLRCNLLHLDEKWIISHDIDGHYGFARHLANHNPFDAKDFEKYGALYWIEPELTASEETRDLIENFHIDLSSNACEPLMERIEGSFERHGMKFGEILIPIDMEKGKR